MTRCSISTHLPPETLVTTDPEDDGLIGLKHLKVPLEQLVPMYMLDPQSIILNFDLSHTIALHALPTGRSHI